MEQLFEKTLNSFGKLLDELIKEDDSPYTIVDKLNVLFHSKQFDLFAQNAARKMVTSLNKNTYVTWRKAARMNAKGKIVFMTLQKELESPMGGFLNSLIGRNAEIIKTLPLSISQKVTNYIKEETLKGTRASEIAKQIKKEFPDKSKASARMIARTEVSKTQTELTRVRAENIGINWYIWRTSEDQRVRSSHEHMEDVLIRWSEPPSPEALDGQPHTFGHYHAGEIFNCRCYPEPVVDIDMVRFPHKAYVNGRIQTLTKKQFEELQ